jgi:acyl carrier protein
MAVNATVPAELREAKQQSLQTGMLSAEGVEAFTRAVESGLPQVVVSTKDLHLIIYLQRLATLVASRGAAGGQFVEAGSAGPQGGSRHARPELATAFVAPRTDEERGIAGIWSALLGIEGIGVHDNFFELGGHSLLATQVLARLQDSVGVSLPLETIFDAPTVAQLAERVTTLKWISEGKSADKGDQTGREEFEL